MAPHSRKHIFGLSFLLSTLIFTGCSSIFDARKQKKDIMSNYIAGNYQEAIKLTDEKLKNREGSGDELMWRLEEGTLKFDESNYGGSLSDFEKAELIATDFDNRADANIRRAGAEVGSAMTNPNALPYRGLNSDRIMLQAYKFFDYATRGNSSGAMVELRRMRERQKIAEQELQDEIAKEQEGIVAANRENAQKSQSQGRPSSVYFATLGSNGRISQSINEMNAKINKTYSACMNPFAVYLSAIGYLYENNFGEALVDFRRLFEMVPENSFVRRDFTTCSSIAGFEIPETLKDVKPFDFPLETGTVYVIFANGRGAALKQVKIDLILPFVGYTGFAYPELEYFPSPYDRLMVTAGNGEVVPTETVADMDAIISQEYSQRLPGIITRIAISTIAKEVASAAAVYAARKAKNGWATAGAYVATGIYKYLFNTADTRCWETLPKYYQICQLKMPENETVQLTPCIGNYTVPGKTIQIRLDKNKKINIIYVKSQSPDVFLGKVFFLN